MSKDILNEKLNGELTETITQKDLDLYADWVKKHETNYETGGHCRTMAEVFGSNNNVVVAGIKLPASPFFSKEASPEKTKTLVQLNIEALKSAGIKSAVLDTTFDRPHPLIYRDLDILDYYLDIANYAKAIGGDMKLGINMLLFDLPAAMAVAKIAKLDFVFSDIFADPVFVPTEESHRNLDTVFIPRPDLFDIYRNAIGANHLFLFAGIESKFFPHFDNKSLFERAEAAKKGGVDAFLIADYRHKEILNVRELGVPLVVMGGVKEADINEIINSSEFSGFSAGSMFEASPGTIDKSKTQYLVKRYNLV
jgi:predicted TIM-barrel enzyme